MKIFPAIHVFILFFFTLGFYFIYVTMYLAILRNALFLHDLYFLSDPPSYTDDQVKEKSSGLSDNS